LPNGTRKEEIAMVSMYEMQRQREAREHEERANERRRQDQKDRLREQQRQSEEQQRRTERESAQNFRDEVRQAQDRSDAYARRDRYAHQRSGPGLLGVAAAAAAGAYAGSAFRDRTQRTGAADDEEYAQDDEDDDDIGWGKILLMGLCLLFLTPVGWVLLFGLGLGFWLLVHGLVHG
jgi:hypothetical protein